MFPSSIELFMKGWSRSTLVPWSACFVQWLRLDPFGCTLGFGTSTFPQYHNESDQLRVVLYFGPKGKVSQQRLQKQLGFCHPTCPAPPIQRPMRHSDHGPATIWVRKKSGSHSQRVADTHRAELSRPWMGNEAKIIFTRKWIVAVSTAAVSESFWKAKLELSKAATAIWQPHCWIMRFVCPVWAQEHALTHSQRVISLISLISLMFSMQSPGTRLQHSLLDNTMRSFRRAGRHSSESETSVAISVSPGCSPLYGSISGPKASQQDRLRQFQTLWSCIFAPCLACSTSPVNTNLSLKCINDVSPSLLLIWYHITSLQFANCAGSQCLVKRIMKPTSNVAKNMPEPWDLIIFISTFDIDIEGVCAGLALYNQFFLLEPYMNKPTFLHSCIPVSLRRIRGTWWTVRPSPTRRSLSICVLQREFPDDIRWSNSDHMDTLW